MIIIKQNKTKIENMTPIREMKIEINLEDLQDNYTQDGEEATALALGRKLLSTITLNKKK